MITKEEIIELYTQVMEQRSIFIPIDWDFPREESWEVFARAEEIKVPNRVLVGVEYDTDFGGYAVFVTPERFAEIKQRREEMELGEDAPTPKPPAENSWEYWESEDVDWRDFINWGELTEQQKRNLYRGEEQEDNEEF